MNRVSLSRPWDISSRH